MFFNQLLNCYQQMSLTKTPVICKSTCLNDDATADVFNRKKCSFLRSTPTSIERKDIEKVNKHDCQSVFKSHNKVSPPSLLCETMCTDNIVDPKQEMKESSSKYEPPWTKLNPNVRSNLKKSLTRRRASGSLPTTEKQQQESRLYSSTNTSANEEIYSPAMSHLPLPDCAGKRYFVESILPSDFAQDCDKTVSKRSRKCHLDSSSQISAKISNGFPLQNNTQKGTIKSQARRNSLNSRINSTSVLEDKPLDLRQLTDESNFIKEHLNKLRMLQDFTKIASISSSYKPPITSVPFNISTQFWIRHQQALLRYAQRSLECKSSSICTFIYNVFCT